MIQQSRAYGETDVDVRLRVLESQRDVDHAYLGKMAKSMTELAEDNERKDKVIQEHARVIQEQARLNFQFRHELEAMKGTVEAKANEFGIIIEGKMEQAMKEMMTQTAQAMATLEAQLKSVFDSIAGTQDQSRLDGKIIEQAFKRAQDDLNQVKGFIAASSSSHTPSHPPGIQVSLGEPVIFTKNMHDDLKFMYEKIKGIEEFQNGAKLLNDRVGVIGGNLDELHGSVGAHGFRILQLEQRENSRAPDDAFRAGVCGAGPCGGGTGFGRAAPASAPPGDQPGSSRDGDPYGLLTAIIGGNGVCHCSHVKTLIEKVAALEQNGGRARAAAASERGHDPLLETGWQPPKGETQGTANGTPKKGELRGPDGRLLLPLRLAEPLGSVGYKEKPLFDEKLAEREEYRYNGTKNGVAWKGKVERHFISRAPVLRTILIWAEEENLDEVTPESFAGAVGPRLSEEQVIIANAALWGFLSSAVSGAAETLFKGAAMLNGPDAWRRLTRYIDQGKAIRLESLRRDVKNITLRPIPSLDKIEEGIAEFENTLREYTDAGGTAFSEHEMKNDLLQILPGELSETLLWKATDDSGFQKFRDHVITMAAKILQNRRKLPIHAVAEDGGPDDDQHEELDLSNVRSMDDLVMALGKWNNRRSSAVRRPPPRSTTSAPPPRSTAPARQPNRGGAGGDRPRKCPNCNGEHPERRCPKPAVAIQDRTCWQCLQKGHVSSKCPQRQTALRAIEDGPASPGVISGFFMVEDDGFQVAKRGKRTAKTKPMPVQAQLGDFVSKTIWDAIREDEEPETERKTTKSTV